MRVLQLYLEGTGYIFQWGDLLFMTLALLWVLPILSSPFPQRHTLPIRHLLHWLKTHWNHPTTTTCTLTLPPLKTLLAILTTGLIPSGIACFTLHISTEWLIITTLWFTVAITTRGKALGFVFYWLILITAIALGYPNAQWEWVEATLLTTAIATAWYAWTQPAPTRQPIHQWYTTLSLWTLRLLILWITIALIAVLISIFLGEQQFTPYAITAFLETNWQEAYEYIMAHHAHITLTLGGTLFLLSASWLWTRIEHSRKRPPLPPSLTRANTLLAFCLFLLSPIGRMDFLRDLYQGYNLYAQAIQQFYQMKQHFQTQQNVPVEPLTPHTQHDTSEVYILLLGESHNKWFTGLYDFILNTTPRLYQRYLRGELIRFRHVFSSETHTSLQVPILLTLAGCLDSTPWSHYPSLIRLFQSAGFYTVWISNQSKYGTFVVIIALFAEEADTTIWMTHHTRKILGLKVSQAHYDSVLFQPLYHWLHTSPRPLFIVVHLLGNHSLYEHRYPPQWAYYHDPQTHSQTLISTYLNSIRYLDFILDSMLTIIEQSGAPALVWYIADHSEELFLKRLHSTANFDFEMTQVPVFVWATPSWRQRHPHRWQTLHQLAQHILPADYLSGALLGSAGYQTPLLPTSHNPWTNPNLPWQQCRVAKQGYAITDPKNIYLWTEILTPWIQRCDTIGCQILVPIQWTGEIGFALYHGIQGIFLTYSEGPYHSAYPTLPIDSVHTLWLIRYLAHRYLLPHTPADSSTPPARRFHIYVSVPNATAYHQIQTFYAQIQDSFPSLSLHPVCPEGKDWCQPTDSLTCLLGTYTTTSNCLWIPASQFSHVADHFTGRQLIMIDPKHYIGEKDHTEILKRLFAQMKQGQGILLKMRTPYEKLQWQHLTAITPNP